MSAFYHFSAVMTIKKSIPPHFPLFIVHFAHFFVTRFYIFRNINYNFTYCSYFVHILQVQ